MQKTKVFHYIWVDVLSWYGDSEQTLSAVPLKVDDVSYGEDSEPSVNMAGEAMWRY